MSSKMWIGILTGVLAVCLGMSAFLLAPGENAAYAEIISDGQVMHLVSLHVDRQITVTTADGGRNVITVKDGKIAVTEANCPDHYCMHRGYCSGGAQIVCLPNSLVIRFRGEQELDAVVG